MTAAIRVSAVDSGAGVHAEPRAFLLFDDRCSVCRRFVAFVQGVNRVGAVRVASLHSLFGDAIRRTHAEFADRDSVLFVRPDGVVVAYSDAVLASLEQVGGVWRQVARALQRVPRRIRDRVYNAFTGRQLRVTARQPVAHA